MRKRVLAGLVGGTLMAALVAGAGSAAPPGGCPSGPNEQSGLPAWTLFMPIGDDARFDRNGDGWICVRGVGQEGVTAADPDAPGNSVTTINLGTGTFGAVVKDNNSGPKD